MPMPGDDHRNFDGGFYAFFFIVFGIVAAFAATASAHFVPRPSDVTYGERALIHGFGWGLVALGILLLMALADGSQARKKERADQAALAKELRRREATLEAEARRDARLRIESDIRAQQDADHVPVRLTEIYDLAIGDLEEAASHLEKAVQHRERTAYTPFWESCEGAAMALDRHHQRLKQMTRLVIEHGEEVARLKAKTTGGAWVPTAIPFELTQVSESAAALHLIDRLTAVTYEAQTEFHFAAIFEQRRNTAVLERGFQALMQAIDGLQSAIFSSQAALLEAYRDLNASVHQVVSSVDTSGDKVTGKIASVSNDHSPNSIGAAIRDINRRLERI